MFDDVSRTKERNDSAFIGPTRRRILSMMLLGSLIVYVSGFARLVLSMDARLLLGEGQEERALLQIFKMEKGPSRPRTTLSSPHVHERSRDATTDNDKLFSPIYVAIPSVPRTNDPDYLIQVLESLMRAKFPMENVYIFFTTTTVGPQDQNDDNNLKNNTTRHIIWDQAFDMYAKFGVHFLWNHAPPPEMHPASLDSRLPLPNGVKMDGQLWDAMRYDSVSRKRWRSKECHDYRVLADYMVKNVGGEENGLTREPWIIINQDDVKWMVDFDTIVSKLMGKRGIVDLANYSTALSIAYRTSHLTGFVDFGELYCDFKPVDWSIHEYGVMKNITIAENQGLVEHIGHVSSREGRVDKTDM